MLRALAGITLGVLFPACLLGQPPRPNVVLVMADDQGWGQVGYRGHPVLRTPHLDAMAAAGLRFDRFYAGGPVCSPTRATVLTGRTHNRTGVEIYGGTLCLQERTLPRALQRAGYATAHFGKWHLNGVRGPGVPILGDDPFHPGRYGFDAWLSMSNYFDLDPLMSRGGRFEEFEGDTSDILVAEALEFIADRARNGAPFFTVIWFGSPHGPMRALPADVVDVPNKKLANHLGEIVAIDRGVGALRRGLRDLGVADQTFVWYCSDNGGLTLDPDGRGGLRGHKGTLYEGGLRVPAIVEWPGRVEPAVTEFPASTLDILPTMVELLGLPDDSQLAVTDGESIGPLFAGDAPKRTKPIPFVYQGKAAFIEGDHKLLSVDVGRDDSWTLYNLRDDPHETRDLAAASPERLQAMKSHAKAVLQSVRASARGRDYPEGRIVTPLRRAFWHEMPEYGPHFAEFLKRPEYQGYQEQMEAVSRTGD